MLARRNGTLPFVASKTKGHDSFGQAWPEQPVTIPLSLMVSGGVDYKELLWRSLKLLLSPLSAASKPQDMAWNLETELFVGFLPVVARTRRVDK